MKSATRVWLTVGPAALAAGVGALTLVLTSEHEEQQLLTSILGLLLGWSFAVAGLIARTRRPENRTGVLLLAVGLTFFVGALAESNSSLPFTIGHAVGAIFVAALVHLLLAYPTGRLTSRWERMLVASGYAIALLANAGPLLFDRQPLDDCEACPSNAFLVVDSPLADDIASVVFDSLGALFLLAVAVVLVRRWRSSSAAARRLLGPVLLAGVATVFFFALSIAVYPLSSSAADLVGLGFVIGIIALPFVFLWGVLRSRLARADVSALLDAPEAPTLLETQDALRATLRDPTLQLVYWVDERRAYCDVDGRKVELPDGRGERVATEVDSEDGPLAALVHDPALLDDPERIASVTAALRLRLEKDRSVRALRISEYRSRALLDAIPDTMFRISRDGRFLDFRTAEPDRLITTPDQIVGTSVYDIPADRIAPEVIEERMALAERAFETGQVQTQEYEVRSDGQTTSYEARIVPSGEDEFVMIVRDVTEQKLAEARIERQRDFLSAMGDATTALLCVIRPNGKIGHDSVNVPLRELSGYAQHEVDGRLFWEAFVRPEDAPDAERVIQEVAAGRSPGEQESRWLTKAGRTVTVAWTCTRLPDSEEGEALLISGTDVTERVRHGEQIQTERDFFGVLIDATPSFICTVDHEGRMSSRSINETMMALSGYTEPEVAGRAFSEVFSAPEDAGTVDRVIAAAAGGESPGEQETHWLTRDGRRVLVAWTCTQLPERDASQRLVISGTDITERKRQEDEQAALRRVAVAVASERRPEDVFQTVTEEVARVLGGDRAHLLRFDAEAAEAVVVGIWESGEVEGDVIGRRIGVDRGPYSTIRDSGRPTRLDLDGPISPALRERLQAEGVTSVVVAPVLVSGSLWGAATVSATQGMLPPETEERIAQFTSLVATALANAEAREELHASRARIVEAGDAERRRLERNLHDGAQQRLVSLSLSLRLAQAKLIADPHAADEILSGASIELGLALEELRELARGIHPAVLTDRGLGPALESLADRAPLPVELAQLPDGRLPEPVEAAAFYVVSEALANVTKYADASAVSVRIARENGLAVVEVSDDGVGGADPLAGSGLRGLADRIEALDGRLAVDSPPGAGTRIRAEIPCG